LVAHYVKKGKDAAYAKECDDERDAAFFSTDANNNGLLDLEEYINFCKTSCGNISRRIGIEMKVNDD
jgi:phosphoribulokinase